MDPLFQRLYDALALVVLRLHRSVPLVRLSQTCLADIHAFAGGARVGAPRGRLLRLSGRPGEGKDADGHGEDPEQPNHRRPVEECPRRYEHGRLLDRVVQMVVVTTDRALDDLAVLDVPAERVVEKLQELAGVILGEADEV